MKEITLSRRPRLRKLQARAVRKALITLTRRQLGISGAPDKHVWAAMITSARMSLDNDMSRFILSIHHAAIGDDHE